MRVLKKYHEYKNNYKYTLYKRRSNYFKPVATKLKNTTYSYSQQG